MHRGGHDPRGDNVASRRRLARATGHPSRRREAEPGGRRLAHRRDWARSAADAGKPHRDCCLDAFPCTAKEGGPKVVASSVCVERPWGYIRLPGTDAADYKILVYDASGIPAPRLRPAGPPSGKLTGTGRDGGLIGIGDAIGAVIPLTEWFDMKKPGRYSVLVSPPSPGSNDPPWVAEPITVTVPNRLHLMAREPRQCVQRLSFAHGIGNNGCGDFTKTAPR